MFRVIQSLMIWEEIPEDTIHRLIKSMHTSAQGTRTFLSCCNEIFAKWASLLHQFFTDFQFVFAHLQVNNFKFYKMMQQSFTQSISVQISSIICSPIAICVSKEFL